MLKRALPSSVSPTYGIHTMTGSFQRIASADAELLGFKAIPTNCNKLESHPNGSAQIEQRQISMI